MAYLTLFVSAFTAATLLPGSSEVLLLALQQQGYLPVWLWLFATTGNTLGSCVNWYLGKEVNRFQHKRWFPFTPAQMTAASLRFQRYGSWSLLLSWLPVVGDPLTLIAGVLRVRFSLFLLLVALGKGLRYAVLLGLGMAIFP
ncbi:YqaA family protein [Alkalimonas sp.]|uniref:YqaA family protein n=1 Tax=Alkalimonas sp. TaxID=1872453 RepID=UPI00263A6E64|nr:YqaA family protein [Alkalimonas sp.]MCC5826880.1 DedA family protein [Alkalimonas sp.]